jgi:hypothetical protein
VSGVSAGFQRGEWQVADRFGDEWTISFAPPGERGEGEGGTLDAVALDQVEQLVFDAFDHGGVVDDRIAGPLLEIYDALTNEGLSSAAARPSDDPRRALRGFDREIRQALLGAFTAQELRIARIEKVRLRDVPDDAPTQNDAAPVSEVTTWIGLCLVDQNGKPVGRRRYQITLPDGTVTQGVLASDGTARIEGIATAGTCQIDFLDFDKVDWGPQTLMPGATAPAAPESSPASSAPASGATAADAAPASSPPSQPPSQSSTHLVTHTFVDASGNPVASISWQVTSSDGTVIGSGVTDSTGAVSCTVPNEGDYTLSYDHQLDDAAPGSGEGQGIDTTEDYSNP